ncbi:FAD/NAD(P)-binding protein [Mucilaginibacter sp.]|uniref:FAD/NAD(P)-binding protein n=1 Tax=Mucilaginibacter sp. TaxID=1882438 RepID=UPI003D14147D
MDIRMEMQKESKNRVAILGGGPSGLFMFKRLIESGKTAMSVIIFERKNRLGAGMPYSREGAGDEHITNVSSNEIPLIVTTLAEWIKTVPKDTLATRNALTNTKCYRVYFLAST